MADTWFIVRSTDGKPDIHEIPAPVYTTDSKSTMVIDHRNILLVSGDVFEIIGVAPKYNLDARHPMAKFGGRKFYGITPTMVEVIEKQYERCHVKYPDASFVMKYIIDKFYELEAQKA